MQRSVTVYFTISGQYKLLYKAVLYRNGKKVTGERWTVVCTTVFSNSRATGASKGVWSICHAVHHSLLTLFLYNARLKHFTSTSTLTQKLHYKSH